MPDGAGLDVDKPMMALLSHMGWLSAVNDDPATHITNTMKTVGEFEQFTPVYKGKGEWHFKAHNGQFVTCASQELLNTEQKENPNAYATFKVYAVQEKDDGMTPGAGYLAIWNVGYGKWLKADGVMRCNKSGNPSTWEKFGGF